MKIWTIRGERIAPAGMVDVVEGGETKTVEVKAVTMPVERTFRCATEQEARDEWALLFTNNAGQLTVAIQSVESKNVPRVVDGGPGKGFIEVED